jgi:hypothetical protein
MGEVPEKGVSCMPASNVCFFERYEHLHTPCLIAPSYVNNKPDSFARWLKSPTVNFLETSTNTLSPALPQSQNIHCHMLLVIL